MEGYIFNIQKFSLHDGPGIRTTVFFKGCNLHCKWCANPESQQLKPQLSYDADKCAGCLKCADSCSNAARSRINGSLHLDSTKCNLCGKCMELCPAQAIGCEGRLVSSEEIVREALKDKAFYDQSGGGVTFSGGEVLLQQDFAVEIARMLRAEGVHIAAETAAAVPNERFKAFLREIDYVFADIKHYDSARHREGTGIGNEIIIENIRSIVESGLPYTIRIPVIPGYNDTSEDAEGFAGLLAQIGVKHVEALPFHQLGERKYRLIGREYEYSGKKQLHREDISHFYEVFRRNGIELK